MINKIFSFFGRLFHWLITNLFLLLLKVINLLISFLPNMPEYDSAKGSFAVANDILPVTEVAGFLSIILLIYGYIGYYKLAKFIRGGG